MFKVLNFDKLSESVISKGIKVGVTSDYNITVAEKGEVRKNVIQVSFANTAILWCLDENKEVIFIEK